jgi:monoamine oxidase
VTFDNSPPSGTPGVLMGFLEGKEARTWARRSQAERRQAVIGCFVRYFGEAAGRPEQYLERDWMAGLDLELGVRGQLLAAVPGHRPAQLRR